MRRTYRVLLFGYGRMGKAIAWALHTLGYEVVCVDSVPSTRATLYKIICTDVQDVREIERVIDEEKPDLILSSLPYFLNPAVARAACEVHIPYADLGGSVPVTEEIHSICKSIGGSVFTDLGLAPGWVNIQAEEGYSAMPNASSVKMFCGGLPNSEHVNPAKYICTWSAEGLLNEYRDDCTILTGGCAAIVSGMSQLEHVTVRGNKYEAFNTSGGASHTIKLMHDRGVKYCAYKTLRYPGHREMLEWMFDSGISDVAVIQLFTSDKKYEDHIVTHVTVRDNEYTTWSKSDIIMSDSRFSAMQRCTAFPFVSAAIQMIGNVRTEGLSGIWTYAEVDQTRFNDTLEMLGL